MGRPQIGHSLVILHVMLHSLKKTYFIFSKKDEEECRRSEVRGRGGGGVGRYSMGALIQYFFAQREALILKGGIFKVRC